MKKFFELDKEATPTGKEVVSRTGKYKLILSCEPITTGDFAYCSETDEIITVKKVEGDALFNGSNRIYYNNCDPFQFYKVIQVIK